MPQPWEMTFEEFTGPALVGPEYEFDGRAEDYSMVWEADANQQPVLWEKDYFSIHDLEWDDGTTVGLAVFNLALDRHEFVGFYTQGMCWIDSTYRGRGFSVEMILAAARLCGGSPTCNKDGLGFSEAGIAAHRAAHRTSVERAIKDGLKVPVRVLAEYGLNQVVPAP